MTPCGPADTTRCSADCRRSPSSVFAAYLAGGCPCLASWSVMPALPYATSRRRNLKASRAAGNLHEHRGRSVAAASPAAWTFADAPAKQARHAATTLRLVHRRGGQAVRIVAYASWVMG